MDDKNVLRKLLREVVNNAVARGHLPDDDLLDELASMGPAPSADFRQRLERQLVDELRAQEKKRGNDQMATLLTDERRWRQPIIPTRTGSRITLAAAVLTVAMLGAFLLMNLGGGDSLSVSYIRSAEDINREAFTLYIDEVWNNGNVDMLEIIASSDVVYHDTTLAEDVIGVQGVSELITNYRAAMLDFTYTVDAMSVDEDRVWAQITASGTHTNTLQLSDGLSIPASMNTATWSVTVVSRFEDGKIAETWVQADTLDLMQQIGAMPMLQEFTTEEQNIERVRQYVDAVNARDFDAAFEQTYAESWVFYDPYTRASYNARPSDSTNYLRGIERSFPDFTFTIEHIAAAGNIVFVQSTFTGTFEASFVPTGTSAVCGATNEEASWEEIRILRFEDGFVVEEWLYIDDPMANQPELYCAR